MNARRLLPALMAAALASASAADDPPRGRVTPHRHELVLVQERAELGAGGLLDAAWEAEQEGIVLGRSRGRGRCTSAVLELQAFGEALPSWNVEVPSGAGIAVELRVGRGGERGWSPWLFVGQWGTLPASYRGRVSFDGGRIDVDWFRGEGEFERAQLRVLGWSEVGGPAPVVRRLALCATHRSPEGERALESRPEPERALWQRALDVPPRRQGAERPELAPRICSPTSVSMLLAYRGVERPTEEVAQRLWDPLHDLYGNWPRAVQGAYDYGLPGYLARFNDWADVRHCIAAGQPLICSIAAAEGELSGAPYARTGGHLIVLVGFDERGDVIVNDPAAPSLESVRRVYRRAELEHCWMRRGGTAYVLEPSR